MKLIDRMKVLFTGKIEITVDDLDIISNEIVKELNDVIEEFKKLDKKWTWKIWSAWELYKPIVQQTIEFIKEIGEQIALTNEQKKKVAEMVIWKVIEPFLPTYIKVMLGWVIKKGIDIAIEKIYEWLKIGKIQSEVFAVNSVR